MASLPPTTRATILTSDRTHDSAELQTLVSYHEKITLQGDVAGLGNVRARLYSIRYLRIIIP